MILVRSRGCHLQAEIHGGPDFHGDRKQTNLLFNPNCNCHQFAPGRQQNVSPDMSTCQHKSCHQLGITSPKWNKCVTKTSYAIGWELIALPFGATYFLYGMAIFCRIVRFLIFSFKIYHVIILRIPWHNLIQTSYPSQHSFDTGYPETIPVKIPTMVKNSQHRMAAILVGSSDGKLFIFMSSRNSAKAGIVARGQEIFKQRTFLGERIVL